MHETAPLSHWVALSKLPVLLDVRKTETEAPRSCESFKFLIYEVGRSQRCVETHRGATYLPLFHISEPTT